LPPMLFRFLKSNRWWVISSSVALVGTAFVLFFFLKDKEPTRTTYDIPYSDASPICKLDISVPKRTGKTPLPLIVVIHGGGWIGGDKGGHSIAKRKHRYSVNIQHFAEEGFIAAAINYRLAGEAPFPAQLNDCEAAISWLRSNAGRFHLDPDRVGIYGESAGGNLALLVALNPSNQIRAVVSESGVLDLKEELRQGRLLGAIQPYIGGGTHISLIIRKMQLEMLPRRLSSITPALPFS